MDRDSQRPGALPSFNVATGLSKAMQRVYHLVYLASRHSFPVLIRGESGTGKELVARSIHSLSQRRLRSFVPVDCTTLVPTLVESELFGHVRGAFTGAIQARPGLLETAGEGTLYLDEIGDMRLEIQPKLLRALQERELRRVGGNERTSFNARVISATNCDLEARMRGGSFRQDLYFRLNVLEILVPPLRDRKCDIPGLVALFAADCAGTGCPSSAISDGAMAALMAYDWPGNVRELQNAIQHAVAMSTGGIMQLSDLPETLQPKALTGEEIFSLRQLERRAILLALEQKEGDRIAVARLLHIGRTTLYRKLKQYGRQAQRS